MSGGIDHSCNADFQCDVEYGCITSREWPFISSCQKLKTEGEEEVNMCENDNNCSIDHYCWYPTPEKAKADQKYCMKMFEKPNFTIFGYKKQEKEFKYSYRENMFYGRYCKSGIAVINEAKS